LVMKGAQATANLCLRTVLDKRSPSYVNWKQAADRSQLVLRFFSRSAASAVRLGSEQIHAQSMG
jgi:hypothetical protein